MSARASGTDASKSYGASDEKHRSHHDGSAGRAYTAEQKASVMRVRRCSPTAFYDILGLEAMRKSCSESDIKKAYRKLSLLTHPDKNGYKGADEAFKMVSRAFQVLSDADKKAKYDQFGGDPESRTAQAGDGGGSPFAGFGQRAGASNAFYDDGPGISPEDLFRQFFGGGMGGGMGGSPFGFETGPQFVFNMGGQGIRMTNFGGQAPRRRPAQQNNNNSNGQAPDSSISGILMQLLPLLALFALPILSFLFNSAGSSHGPSFRLDQAVSPHTRKLSTPAHKVAYWVNPREYEGLSSNQRRDLSRKVDLRFVSDLRIRCQAEVQERDDLVQQAQGWFSNDEAKLKLAHGLPLSSCRRLNDFKDLGYGYY